MGDFAQNNGRDVYWHYNPGPEIYSRKVFVGGLPIDADEGTFRKGFFFLIFAGDSGLF